MGVPPDADSMRPADVAIFQDSQSRNAAPPQRSNLRAAG